MQAWKTVFGDDGERGEYMDGYSEQAMLHRCVEDYLWRSKYSPELFASERKAHHEIECEPHKEVRQQRSFGPR